MCFVQQVYRSASEPGLGALTQTTDRSKSQVRELTEHALSSAAPGAIDASSNAPPPKPTKFLPAPLINWYIGPRPLDPSQPIRVGQPLRDRPVPERINAEASTSSEPAASVDALVDATQAGGIEVMENQPDSPRLLEPDIPPSPSAPVNEAPAEPALKGRRKKGAGAAHDDVVEDPSGKTKKSKSSKAKANGKEETPVSSKGKGGPRKSKGRTSDIRAESTPASSRGTEAGSPVIAGVGRTKGKTKTSKVQGDKAIKHASAAVAAEGSPRDETAIGTKTKRKGETAGPHEDTNGLNGNGDTVEVPVRPVDAVTPSVGMFWRSPTAAIPTA